MVNSPGVWIDVAFSLSPFSHYLVNIIKLLDFNYELSTVCGTAVHL